MTLDPATLKKLTCPSSDTPVWLHVGTLLDGTSTPRSRVHVIYNANSILYVGEEAPPANLTQSKTAPDVSLDDYTLMPGLIDAHTHVFLDGSPLELDVRKAYLKQDNDAVLKVSRGRLTKLMSTGVLAMRDGGDNRGVGLKLAAEYRQALQEGRSGGSPYIDSPGPGINKQGRYGSFMCEPVENEGSPETCVAGRVKRGADRIKLIATGIINFKKGAVTAPPQMDQIELSAFAAAAKEHDRSTFAHASGDDGIEHVIEAGIDSVEHGYFVRDDQLQRMADRQIAWVPTLAPVQI
ncbi:MAG: amidohydrolase family protein, partial [Algisphaera sp.]